MGLARDSRLRPAPRMRRWLGWLLAGLAIGLLVGFAAGLTRPRPSVLTPGWD